MSRTTVIRAGALALLVLTLVSSPTLAHEHSDQYELRPGDLGSTHFPNSGSRAAQKSFLRGLLLLHSFEYASARKAFQDAEAMDPGFAMAFWGEALSFNQTLWGEQDIASARRALEKLGPSPSARAARAPTARERGYLHSVELLYGEGSKAERDARFSKALESLAHEYPEDLDARAFYSLSLLGLSNGVRDIPNYMRAAAEAETVYEKNPHHPGALHYLIHAYDDPVHAPLGLRAARLYGTIVTSASHAQHMPSHIFFALGLWDDAINANIASLKAGRAHGDPAYHSLLWLAYAYLQQGRYAEAKALIDSVEHDVTSHPTRENRLRLAYARAMWLVETRGVGGPDVQQQVASDDVASIGYFADQDFAQGLTAAFNDDLVNARIASARLESRIAGAHINERGSQPAWYDTVSDEELRQCRALATALAGVIRFREGDRDGGLATVRGAIADTRRMEFEYGPPWSVKPLDELLGELLLEAGRKAEARQAFEDVLRLYPNRRLAREGVNATEPVANPASTQPSGQP